VSATHTPLLDTIKVPEDLRQLPENQLKQVADELRGETISAVSVTGGNLGAGLGPRPGLDAAGIVTKVFEALGREETRQARA